MEQIRKIKTIQINNPIKTIEENKKCIIQHKIIHKDYQQAQMLEEVSKNSEQSLRTEAF